MDLINGGVYEGDKLSSKFVLIFLDLVNSEPMWGMMFLNRHEINGLTSLMFQHDVDGIWAFSEDDLRNKYDSDDWIMLDGRVRIEKINEMSFTEYVSGGELETLILD